jgi:GNAT superfamily N-acetyltransferase
VPIGLYPAQPALNRLISADAGPGQTPSGLNLNPVACRYPMWDDERQEERMMSDYRLRHLRAGDEAALIDFHDGCSEETHYLRFFAAKPSLSEPEAAWFCAVDGDQRGAVVAVDAAAGDRIVGVGRWDRLPGGDEAEIAFVVADDHQSRGIGRTLVAAVIREAQAQGIHWLVGTTLRHNSRMRALLTRSDVPCAWTFDDVAAFRMDVRAGGQTAA